MKPTRRFTLILLLLVLLCGAAYAQTCPECGPPATVVNSTDFQNIYVDAATGTFYMRDSAGNAKPVKAKYKRSDRVRIILLNKNPFRFKYNVVIENTPVPEPDFESFLKLFIPVDVTAAAKPTPAASQQGAQPLACQHADDVKFNLIMALNAELGDTYEKGVTGSGLKPDFDKVVANFKSTQKTVQDSQKTLTAATTSCTTLCQVSGALLSTLDAYKSGFDEIEKRINAYRSDAEALERRVEDYESLSNVDPCERPDLRNVKLSAKAAQAVADEWLKALGKMQDGKKEFDDVAKFIRDEVLSDPFAFYRVYEIEEFDVPTNVTVKVQRKDIVKKETEFSDFVARFPTLNFGGGPRFTLAAGVSLSRLKKQEFQRVQGTVPGQQGLVPLIGLKESSNTRNNFIVMLHARLFDIPFGRTTKVPLHFSLGITRSGDNRGTDPEYLFGPSLSFLDNRLFFTGGAYLGKRQTLEGNLAVGSQVPADLAEIPIRKDNRWGFGFAITYKIGSLSGLFGGEDEKKK